MADSIFEGGGGGGGVVIGAAISGGTANEILFGDGSGNVAQSADLFWDDTLKIFHVGDFGLALNKTFISLDDQNNKIDLQTKGTFKAGDINGYVNGTLISLDDSAKKIKLALGTHSYFLIQNGGFGLDSVVLYGGSSVGNFLMSNDDSIVQFADGSSNAWFRLDYSSNQMSIGDVGGGHHATKIVVDDNAYLFTHTSGIIRGNAFHNNSHVSQGDSTQQDVRSGTYTPTATSVANVASSTNYKAQWLRVGNVVTVSGKISITPTAGGTTTELYITLPVASFFAAEEDCAGVFVNGIDNLNGRVLADITNDKAFFRFKSTGTTAVDFSYHFTYEVLADAGGGGGGIFD